MTLYEFVSFCSLCSGGVITCLQLALSATLSPDNPYSSLLLVHSLLFVIKRCKCKRHFWSKKETFFMMGKWEKIFEIFSYLHWYLFNWKERHWKSPSLLTRFSFWFVSFCVWAPSLWRSKSKSVLLCQTSCTSSKRRGILTWFKVLPSF